MKSHALPFTLALCALTALTSSAPCRADLFALLGSERQIVRLDSTTGAVLDAYPFDTFIPQVTSAAGLAFDGRTLSISDPGGFAPNVLYRYDVNYGFWHLPSPIITDPGAGSDAQLNGLGFLRTENGEWLFGVTRDLSDLPPSHLYQFFSFPPGGPDPLFSGPPQALPAGFAAQGLDADPVTGELWIAGDQIEMQTRTPMLLRTDLTGAVLQTLVPQFDPPTLLRGVGIDGDKLFVAGRNLPTLSNQIYQIDRTTGAVLNTFTLSGPGNTSGLIGGLAGGTIVPEPTSGLLSAGLFGAVSALRGRRRRVRSERSNG